jgi:Tfp pilus tip-associated adhesin PilY1
MLTSLEAVRKASCAGNTGLYLHRFEDDSRQEALAKVPRADLPALKNGAN